MYEYYIPTFASYMIFALGFISLISHIFGDDQRVACCNL